MIHMHLCNRVEYRVRNSVIEVLWKCFSRLSHFPFLWHYQASDVHVEETGPLSEFMHVCFAFKFGALDKCH